MADNVVAADGRVAVVTATFYRDLADRMIAGAGRALAEDVFQADHFEVPGAFELPLAAQYAAESGKYVGVVCLGAVIRGETDHYDYVCGEAASGIQRVSLDTGVPCGFGLLTCENMDQALARTDGSKRDQGYNAAKAVTQMISLGHDLLS